MTSTECKITSFSVTVGGTAIAGTVDDTAHTVGVTVPFGTAVTALAPTIAVSEGATVSPTSGTSKNFTTAQTYTVTAEDATTTQAYTVTVTVAADATTTQVGIIPKMGWFDALYATGSLDAYTSGGVDIGIKDAVKAVVGVQVSGGYIGYFDVGTKKLKIYSSVGTEAGDVNGIEYSVLVLKG